MASIIIDLDTDFEEDVRDLAESFEAVLRLMTFQSVVRSDMQKDAEFVNPEAAPGKLVFAEPGVIVDSHLELPESERYVTVWGETAWFERVKLARFDSTPDAV